MPSPSIFSESPPNTIPTLFGTCISDVAVKLILAPEVIVKSVLSPSIFSPDPKVIPTFAGITTSAVAVKLILLPVIVKSVPSPSIFSPSSPNVKPMFAGIFMSPLDPTAKVMSVPSPEILSSAAQNIIFLPEAIKNAETSPSNLATSVEDPPSLTLNIISLSDVADSIIKSVELFVNVAIVVPPSLKIMSAPSASRIMSVVASSVIVEPESISAITGVVKVLFVKVCVATRDTSVESAPSGNNISFVTAAECG